VQRFLQAALAEGHLLAYRSMRRVPLLEETMTRSVLLQDYLSVNGNGNVIIQNETDWIDVGGFQDACFYFDLVGFTGASGTTNVSIQTAPTKEELFFAASASVAAAIANYQFTGPSPTTGVQPLQVSRWATEVNQPLSRWLRWHILLPGVATSLCFRIWVSLNAARSRRPATLDAHSEAPRLGRAALPTFEARTKVWDATEMSSMRVGGPPASGGRTRRPSGSR
jgi:hypothetical protein